MFGFLTSGGIFVVDAFCVPATRCGFLMAREFVVSLYLALLATKEKTESTCQQSRHQYSIGWWIRVATFISIWNCCHTCSSDRLKLVSSAYTYIHTYMHTYIHTYIHTYTITYRHAYIHTCIHKYKHTYIHTNKHTRRTNHFD